MRFDPISSPAGTAGQRPTRPHGAGASRPPLGPGAALIFTFATEVRHA